MIIKNIFLNIALLGSLTVDAQQLERIVDLNGIWKFTIGDRLEWADTNFDDSQWETIRVPGAWENQGFNGYNGHAWYRTSFSSRELRRESDVYLDLGYIDDVDEVFINGNLVGMSGQFPPDFYTAYKAHRRYYIPREYLRINSTNIIAVRVFDVVHGGGIISGRTGIYIPKDFKPQGILLEGMWKFRMGDNPEWRKADYNDDSWGIKMVPSFWWSKHKDIGDYYESRRGKLSYAWYRKGFKLPSTYSDKQMTVVMGKIDDFDKVYLNGHLIGVTNDGRPYGSSDSYKQTRVYEVPTRYLKPGGINVIAVRVTDMGGEAGIYDGPIGIVESSSVNEFLNWGG